MNAKNSFLSDQQQKITEKIEILRLCSKGYHKPDEQGFFCSRCAEQLKEMPEWEVRLICYKGELATSTVLAEDAETALIDVLSNNIQYLIKGHAYTVINKEAERSILIEVDEEMFNEIFDEYEYINNNQEDGLDEIIACVVKDLIVLISVILLVHFLIADELSLLRGLLFLLSIAVFITLLMFKGFIICENHKKKDAD